MPDHFPLTFLASSSDKRSSFFDWAFLEICCLRLTPPSFICARSDCELHSGDSTCLVQKVSPWPVVCLRNWQYRDTDSWHCFSAQQLNFTWAEAITSLCKSLFEGFELLFPVCMPRGCNNYALHYYGKWAFSVGKPCSLLRSQPTWTAKHTRKGHHKHSQESSNGTAEAALLS